MSNSQKLNVLLVLLATISRSFTREPACSRFAYEEQLLEKMIRQEIKVEAMETEIKKTLKSITTFMENMEQKMDNKVVDMNNEIKLNMDKVSVFVDNVKLRMDSFVDDMTDRNNELQLQADKVDVPRVAFNVYNLKDVNVVTKGQVFVFTTILLNEGDGYDSSTGIFTASVAGLYYFTAHVCTQPASYGFYGIMVDDQLVAVSNQRDKDYHSCSSVSTVNVLKTESTVSVQSTISSTSNILYQDTTYRRITFSGALLHR